MTSHAVPESISTPTTRPGPTKLRLYVARGTPNSTRAAQNLRAALDEMDSEGGTLGLEIVDVFTHVKLVLSDDVIVTPTLIGVGRNERQTLLGDLSDTPVLHLFLRTLREL